MGERRRLDYDLIIENEFSLNTFTVIFIIEVQKIDCFRSLHVYDNRTM